MRPFVGHYGLPDRLDGLRVLDVGTWDGFWAFELERRGAAEVVALDLDHEAGPRLPAAPAAEGVPDPAAGRELRDGARAAGVEGQADRLQRSTTPCPEDLGTFDLVFCGSVIMHLRDQLLALERIAGLCSGTFISAEEYDRLAELIPFPVSRYRADREAAVVFWLPSARTWRRMLWTAGFDRVEEKARFTLESTNGIHVRHVVHHAHKK